MIRLAIVDDHQMFIDGLKALLANEPDIEVVGSSMTGQHFLEHYDTWRPDVTLMDINMPDKDGLETLTDLQKRDANVRVIMLTMFKEYVFINQSMQLGASGYIMKNAGKAELVEAITEVYNGGKHFGAEAIEAFIHQASARESKERKQPKEILTRRELEVLKLVAEEYTSVEIGEKLFISLHTVETHRRNLLSKLDVRNTVGLARYAIQNGLVSLEKR